MTRTRIAVIGLAALVLLLVSAEEGHAAQKLLKKTLYSPPIGFLTANPVAYQATVVNVGLGAVTATVLVCDLLGGCSAGLVVHCSNVLLQPGEACVTRVDLDLGEFPVYVSRYAKIQLNGQGSIEATGALVLTNADTGQVLAVEAE